MAKRLTRITTRTGDKGTTGLGDGSRVAKDDPSVAAIGDVDELNSWLGFLLTQLPLDADVRAPLTHCQHLLFDLGGELAMPGHVAIAPEDIAFLEATLEAMNRDLPPLANFILPGGNPHGAICHLCRTVCRRAERSVVALARSRELNPHGAVLLNRLSDLLFVIARRLTRAAGGAEVLWVPKPERT